MKSEWPLVKQVLKGLVLLACAVLLCRLTKGVATGILAATAVMCAFSGKTGWAIVAYAFFPMLIIMNPFLCPKEGMMGLFARGSTFLVSLALMVSAVQRSGGHALPLTGIWFYLLVAVFSSIGGYAPLVSYLKIVGFSLFIVGLSIGFRNIDKRARDLTVMRTFFFAFVLLMIFGSYFVRIFFPGAAYLATLKTAAAEGLAEANAVVSQGGGRLFAGVVNQSQCLAVIVPACLTWLICDMLFVERRIMKFHLFVFLCGLPIVYMTGARGAFLSTVVAGVVIYFYCVGKVNISRRVRNSLHSMMTFGIVAIVAVCTVMEVKDKSISKWLRKTDDLAGDARGLGEAFTQSRMGKVEEDLFDFRRNPLWGSGFQVSYEMQFYLKDDGFVLSAPIEKGVLPLMVLGETGVVGAVAFAAFLVMFYLVCTRKRYYGTLTLMTVMLTSNMGEATFFSPGGVGGMMWMICIGGGFVVDTVALYRRRIERQLLQMQEMEAMMSIDGGMPMRRI